MLKLVFARLLLLILREPSMLPSREPDSLVLRVSGSANMTDEFLLGEGGPLLPVAADSFADRLCSLDFDRSVVDPPFSSAVVEVALAKGLNMFTRFVGIEGVHLAKLEVLGVSEGRGVATVAMSSVCQWRCTRQLRAKGHSRRET
jgi:hypothetical protein